MNTWEEKLRDITPYVPGEQPDFPDMIKLNTNENPYPPAPGVAKMLKELNADKLTLYPNTSAQPLAEQLSAQYGISTDRIFVGVGSDDVLGMIFMTCFCSSVNFLRLSWSPRSRIVSDLYGNYLSPIFNIFVNILTAWIQIF